MYLNSEDSSFCSSLADALRREIQCLLFLADNGLWVHVKYCCISGHGQNFLSPFFSLHLLASGEKCLGCLKKVILSASLWDELHHWSKAGGSVGESQLSSGLDCKVNVLTSQVNLTLHQHYTPLWGMFLYWLVNTNTGTLAWVGLQDYREGSYCKIWRKHCCRSGFVVLYWQQTLLCGNYLYWYFWWFHEHTDRQTCTHARTHTRTLGPTPNP